MGTDKRGSLRKVLAKYRPARVVSRPAVRCQETVEPFAQASGLKVELSRALEPAAGPEAMTLLGDLLKAGPPKAAVVLCTHREVIADVLPRLSRESGARLEHRLPGAKGSMWVLDFRKKKLSAVAYHPPEK